MRRTGACFCCLAMVALIFAAAPAKAGDHSIDVAVIVYDGVLTSDITAPLEVFGNAARKPWLQKINVEAVAADGDLEPCSATGRSSTLYGISQKRLTGWRAIVRARWCWPKRAFSTENGQRPGQAAKRRFKRSTRTCLCNTTSTSSLMTAS